MLSERSTAAQRPACFSPVLWAQAQGLECANLDLSGSCTDTLVLREKLHFIGDFSSYSYRKPESARGIKGSCCRMKGNLDQKALIMNRFIKTI